MAIKKLPPGVVCERVYARKTLRMAEQMIKMDAQEIGSLGVVLVHALSLQSALTTE